MVPLESIKVSMRIGRRKSFVMLEPRMADPLVSSTENS